MQSVFEAGGGGQLYQGSGVIGLHRLALAGQMMTSLEQELSIDPPIIRTLAVGHQEYTLPLAARCLSMSWWRAGQLL